MSQHNRVFTRILCLTVCFTFLGLWIPITAGATAKNDADQFQALQKKLIKDGFNPEK